MKLAFPLVWLLLAPLALADELDDRLNNLRESFTKELEKTPAAPAVNNPALDRGREQQILSLMTVVEQAAAGGREGTQYLRQSIVTVQGISPEFRKELLQFLDALPSLQEKRKVEYQKAVNDLVQNVQKALPEEKDPEKLNEFLGEMDALQKSRWSSESVMAEQTAQKLQSAIEMTTKWQKFLRSKEAGFPEAALNNLQQMLGDQSDFPLLSAAVIQGEIDKIQDGEDSPTEEVLVILRSVQKASDIPGATQRVNKVSSARPRDEGRTEGAKQRMRSYATTYAASEYGFSEVSGSTTFSLDNTSPFMVELLRIENLLRLDILGRAFAPLSLGPPQEGENQSSYATRLMQEAAAAKNWPLVEKIMSFSSKGLGREESTAQRGQLTALQTFNAAKKLEAANQWASAIQAYRKVISASGDFIPVEEATERLKVLSSQHKDALAQVDREEDIRAIVKSAMEGAGVRGRPPYY